MTGRELYGPVGAKEPILFNGELGWIRVLCEECDRDYDIREVENETTHPHAHHVARFDCPKGHHCEARRRWHSYDDEFLKACGIADQREGAYEGGKQHNGDGATSNCDHGETPEDKERRLALAACLNADMICRGVRDGLCFFDLYYESEGHDGPKVTLSLPTEGLTAEKDIQVCRRVGRKAGGRMKSEVIGTASLATADPELGDWQCPNGHNSAIRPRLPEVMFHACGHYHPTVITWNEFVVSDMRRSGFTGILIARIAPCTTPSTTVGTAGPR
jgi:hypothetical protein